MKQSICQLLVTFPSAARRTLGALGTSMILFLSILVFNSAHAQVPSDAAGRVMFVVGNAHIQPQTGPQQAITKDMDVRQGDKLVTAADAYVYARMADGALLVVRPGSTLSVDLWSYNPDKPEQSQIKYTLHTGLSRYVSGRGSQAAKEKFRFNTPLAAIGVRGTDFTVLAKPGVTEVSVRSGGVVVSGFGGSCKQDALGPCEGRSAAELFANATSGFLQLKTGEQRPQLIPYNGKTGPDQSSPALSNEPSAKEDKANSNATSVLASKVETRIEKAAAELAVPLAAWGRWAGVAVDAAGGGQIVTALLAGRDLAAINSYYVLARNPGVIQTLPETGTGNFKLIDHDGIVINPQTGALENTKAIDGNLTIDFAKRRFQTELKLEALGQTLQVGAAGNVEPGGVLRSDLFITPTSIQGLVGGPGAGQATYIYRRPAVTGPELSGATNWSR